jgi:hypothetical protein
LNETYKTTFERDAFLKPIAAEETADSRGFCLGKTPRFRSGVDRDGRAIQLTRQSGGQLVPQVVPQVARQMRRSFAWTS